MTEKRTFAAIAQDIVADAGFTGQEKRLWSAMPYLRDLAGFHTSDPEADNGWGSARYMSLYALSNLATYKGEGARRLKSELKSML